ncbi:UNVERIFIED_CONTAM: Transcription factor [Sesamum radiatum]|uniref:Transcription factor n=1 Tax=Sesamum radiatum TaxID=300843 RepID=A0AAW2P4G2_SESRA
MGRPPCCDKANVKRGPWTPEEDAKILAYVASHGIGNWTSVPQKADGLIIFALISNDNFTPEEEECILELHRTIGSRWSLIAKRLPGRTDNDVKNYWNTKLKKKLTKMGIDPVTHKPFSQLFSEYGKISGFPSARNGNRFLQNESIWKAENNRQKIHKPYYDLLNDQKNHPVENATQFQAINHEFIQPHFFSEASSCDTFSSSNGVMHFGCGPSHSLHESGLIHNFNGDEYRETRMSYQENSPGVLENCSSVATSSAADSFVEAILAHDNEMRLQFPHILDENYDY